MRDNRDQVINELALELTKNAKLEWLIVAKIKKFSNDHHDIEKYHNYRKRIRTLLKLSRLYPNALLLSDHSLSYLEQTNSFYGEISDLIAKLDTLDKDPNKDLTEKILKKIANKWDKIQNWEKDINAPSQISMIEDELNDRRHSWDPDSDERTKN